MLGPAKRAIREFIRVGAVTTWPLRWSNKRWADGVQIDDNDNPLGDAGQIIPFVEAEIIGGRNAIAGFSVPGNRLWIHPGLLRLYLFVPFGGGTDDADDVADAFSALLERKQITISATRTVRFEDFSSDDEAASSDPGNYFVLMCSVPFEFHYQA